MTTSAAPLERAVSPEECRAGFRSLPTGVVIVTSWLDGRAWGMTVSACCSISVDPPRVLVSLHRATRCRALVCGGGAFGISVLGSAHRDLAELAARPGASKFLDRFCVPGSRAPQVREALCHLECAVDRTLDVADHTLVVARVEEVAPPRAAEPLVYFDRAYRRVGEEV